jgi:carbamoyl-phosphate synthase large subunit
MYCFLKEKGFKTPNSYIDFEKFEDDFNCGKIKFPVFVKPIIGNASIGAYKVENINILKAILNSTEELMIQEYMDGQELGVDVYGDLVSKEVVSIFAKEKIEMRAGATDKAVFRVKGEYYISDVNPRFGAGYLLAYECEERFPEMILENLKGNSVSSKIGQYKENFCIINYEEIKIINN